jgi:hypothetical protein
MLKVENTAIGIYALHVVSFTPTTTQRETNFTFVVAFNFLHES